MVANDLFSCYIHLHQLLRNQQDPYIRFSFGKVVLLGYVVVGTLTVIGRDSTIRGDGVCIIGLKSYATISLIVYDISLNSFLTAMFLWPLWLSHPMSPKLRSIAKRTL
ncbi:uncharacterized protein C8R40DRAFT_81639 [Lentinula edodes]|uniref:uncharacterized protein n=1 Tax=Lentinula edodes TaxID=5353 RepID=UPI001E8E4A20|nr:uncharacterized protein C8R40DRAFT_81639 [Lentinula edodes]KAH7876927.1 hypothetical protein C8R40DRAFT_81639 [Lentinula edodes]